MKKSVKKVDVPLQKFAPNFQTISLSKKEKYLVKPFFTNLNKNTFAVSFLPPEVIGALCSRTSRAKDDLRLIFLKEFLEPFISSKDKYGKSLNRLVSFFHRYPVELIFSNPKGREFYVKWLAQYGDDSIAQMAGAHLVYSSISQIAIKHLEDMRIGLAPIEKSTRYVDYSSKVNGKYRYYTDPTLKKIGLEKEYKKAMDKLFDTYGSIVKGYYDHLLKLYPEENKMVLHAKSFDVARGLLPMATLSQVSFFGNGQSFEYLLARSLSHPLGEIRWAGEEARVELSKIIPAFLRRADGVAAIEYREYLMDRFSGVFDRKPEKVRKSVELADYEKKGEEKVIAAFLYMKSQDTYENIFKKVLKMSLKQKEKIIQDVLSKRKARWHKVPRPFEMANVTFDITMNIGAWRDLHRHRIQTQMRELFTVEHGYDVPKDLQGTRFEKHFRDAIGEAEKICKKIEKSNPLLAQYTVTLAHKVRFLQKQNLRSFFWESELRTIPQGHPDYRVIEQEKAKLVKKVYPIIGKYLMVDMNDYQFARRGTAEKIKEKEKRLTEQLRKK